MNRIKFRRAAVVTVSLLALTSVNFGFLNEIPLIQEETAKAEIDHIIKDFKDENLRRVIVEDYLGGENRAGIPGLLALQAALEGIEYPIYSTDIEALNNIKYFSANAEDIETAEGIEYLKNAESISLANNDIKEINLKENGALKRFCLSFNENF